VQFDKVEFGAQDSYQLMFALDGADLKRLMDQLPAADMTPVPGVGANLGNCGPFWIWRDAAKFLLDRRRSGERGGHGLTKRARSGDS